MKPVDTNLIKRFANEFCYGRKGFSAEEIPKYFSTFQGNVPFIYGMAVTKSVFFCDCVTSLSPENQRQALYDLCDDPPESTHPMPNNNIRKELLEMLVQADGRSPLGIELSSITLTGVREQWMIAASRIQNSPAAAITAARTLFESTCSTILSELGDTPNTSGDVSRLYKQVRDKLGINPKRGASQNVHKLVSGLAQIVDGLAGISNRAGDRHGLVSGTKINDISYASLAVHASGTACVFLVRVYRDVKRGPNP
jgi:hypothetical protein